MSQIILSYGSFIEKVFVLKQHNKGFSSKNKKLFNEEDHYLMLYVFAMLIFRLMSKFGSILE